MRNLRFLTLFAVLLLVLGYINYNAWAKERTIANGQTILLQLYPVDPRSLMQGDYMTLNYELLADLEGESRTMLVTLDDDDIATAIREEADPIAADEHRLKLYMRPNSWDTITVGTNSYFFEEGTGRTYETAVYGEFRVAADGTAILVNLRDEQLNQLDTSR